MKKLFANAVMMIMLLTGCSYTAENFTADYPISGKGAILKFSAADENKITVQTKFPQSDICVSPCLSLTVSSCSRKPLTKTFTKRLCTNVSRNVSTLSP